MPMQNAAELSMQDLSKYFKMPEKAVAKALGICLTSLKKICRQNGINRWPYRKVHWHPCPCYVPLLVRVMCPFCRYDLSSMVRVLLV